MSSNCPLCHSNISTKYTIPYELDDKGQPRACDWLFCWCGCVFHLEGLDKSIFNEEYVKKHLDSKFIKERYEYVRRCYLPLVEELTYGRRFLDVGFTSDLHIKAMKERGWICNGIDLIKNDYITADFEKHNFADMQFDFINMGHVLESLDNPLESLRKAYNLLSDFGALLVTSPDAEMIFLTGVSDFGWWSPEEKWLFFSERKFIEEAKRLGFEVILRRKNFSPRFIAWNDFHILLQKPNNGGLKNEKEGNENGKVAR